MYSGVSAGAGRPQGHGGVLSCVGWLCCVVYVCVRGGRRPAPCLALPHRVTTHPLASSLHLSHHHRRRRTLAHHHIPCRLVCRDGLAGAPTGVLSGQTRSVRPERYNKKWRCSFRKGEGRKPLGWTWPLGCGLPYPGRWNRWPGQLQRQRAVIMHWDSLRDGLSPFVPSVLNLLNTATFVVATKNDNSEVSLFV